MAAVRWLTHAADVGDLHFGAVCEVGAEPADDDLGALPGTDARTDVVGVVEQRTGVVDSGHLHDHSIRAAILGEDFDAGANVVIAAIKRAGGKELERHLRVRTRPGGFFTERAREWL